MGNMHLTRKISNNIFSKVDMIQLGKVFDILHYLNSAKCKIDTIVFSASVYVVAMVTCFSDRVSNVASAAQRANSAVGGEGEDHL